MFKKSEKLRLIREGLEAGKLLGQSIRDAGMKSYTTIDRWRKRPMIDRYFIASMNRMESRRNNAVIDSLFKQAISGNPTCIAIYLKFKMGWKDNSLIDQSSHQQTNITVTRASGEEIQATRQSMVGI